MNVQQRRDKLVEQFQSMIQDEEKMDHLESLFSGMLENEDSFLNSAQTEELLETRRKILSGEMKTTPWSEVKSTLDAKYGV